MSSDGALPLQDDAGEADLESPLGARPTRIAAPAMGAVAARGFYWLTALSLATKALSTVTQIVLSWFMTRTDFGLVATTTTVATFVWLIQDSAYSQILIQRQRRFAVWSTAVFWLVLCLGVISAVLLVSAGAISSRVLNQPPLMWLMAIMALRGFASCVAAVPWSQLNAEMRFGLLAGLGLVLVALERGLMMLLTSPWVRWGAYGYIVALLVVSVARTILLWWYGRSKIKKGFYVRRWKYMARDGWLLTLSQTFQTITSWGDNLLLACFRPQDVVGDYYWAYNLSIQTIILLTGNITGVLFSALSRLQREPERMHNGFLRASRMVAMVGVPGCILQAALARPLAEMLFGARWLSAIPALQVLSLGMGMSLMSYPSVGFLRAQGRFATERTLSGICAAMFLVAATLGAMLGGSLSMGIAVAIYNVIAGFIYLRIALGPVWGEIFSVYLPAWLLSMPTIGLGYLLSRVIAPGTGMHEWLIQIGLVIGVGVPTYTLAARWALPEVWAEMIGHLLPMMRKMGKLVGI